MPSKELLKNLPQLPGVYMMKDASDNIIYVGKAKNLKNRVSQYFQNQKDRAPKVVDMIRNIHSIEYIVVDTELDAFLEECRLIKKLKPMYNRQLKSDRNYVYIKLSDEKYPRFGTVLEKSDDGASYFGPYPSSHMAENTIRFFEEFYPIRKCTTPRLASKPNGCLFLQLGTCIGACTGKVTSYEYRKILDDIVKLLNGKDETPITLLNNKMLAESENMEFEKALKYRDYQRGLSHVIGKQKLIQSSSTGRCILAVEYINELSAKLFFIYGNRMLFSRLFEISQIQNPEFLESLKLNIYDKFGTASKEYRSLTRQDMDEAQIIYSYLKKNKKRIVCFWLPATHIISRKSSKIDATVMKISDVIINKVTDMK